MLNKQVLRWRLKHWCESMDRRVSGSEFHIAGPDTEKARVLVRWMTAALFVDNHSLVGECRQCQKAFVSPVTHTPDPWTPLGGGPRYRTAALPLAMVLPLDKSC